MVGECLVVKTVEKVQLAEKVNIWAEIVVVAEEKILAVIVVVVNTDFDEDSGAGKGKDGNV